MTPGEDDQSVFREPHLRGAPARPDPSESKAERHISKEKARTDPREERAVHSVYNEPAIFPGRESVPIDVDWFCRRCGYNLRGLMTGGRCPECGEVERYEPPRPGEETYNDWLRLRGQGMARAGSWGIILALTLLGGPFAVIGATMAMPRMGYFGAVVNGPVIEEVLKIAAALMLIERRAFWIREKVQLWVMALGTALVFAVIENVVYLQVYLPSPSMPLIAWRWTVCVMLHVGCTAVATRGLVPTWVRARQENRSLQMSLLAPPLITAILLHGAYNLCVMLYGFPGYSF
jgi:hypothetical protein